MKPPVWVDNNILLGAMVEDLRRQSLLAVDTESNSLYVYREQVCLIQFSTLENDYLVDPLVLPDLSSLAPIFSDGAIEKIFHAAEYDLICLRRDFGFEFANIFDTMLGGRILGRAQLGLASMLETEFDVALNKKYQRANWGKRPLPAEQMIYARLDSHYLIPLRHKLEKLLVDSGRWPLAEEDFQRLCDISIPVHVDGVGICMRIAGGQELTPVQTSVLEALCKFREQRAREANQPPFKILSKQILLNIALICPRTRDDLYAVSKLSHRLIKRYGNSILQVVEGSIGGKPVPRIVNNRRHYDDQYVFRIEALRHWRKQKGRSMGVASDVVLPRDILETIAQEDPQHLDVLAQIMQDTPWRFEHYGQQLMQVIHH